MSSIRRDVTTGGNARFQSLLPPLLSMIIPLNRVHAFPYVAMLSYGSLVSHPAHLKI